MIECMRNMPVAGLRPIFYSVSDLRHSHTVLFHVDGNDFESRLFYFSFLYVYFQTIFITAPMRKKVYIYMYIYIFFPQCHHMSFVDYVVLPPGHGSSVTDF